jgi:hypothetical protein
VTARESIDILIDRATVDFPDASTRFDVLDQVVAHTLVGLRILADGIDDLNNRFEVLLERHGALDPDHYDARLVDLSSKIDGLSKQVKKALKKR